MPGRFKVFRDTVNTAAPSCLSNDQNLWMSLGEAA